MGARAARNRRTRVVEAMVLLDTFRIAWDLRLAGTSYDNIAQALGTTVPRVREILATGEDVVTYQRGMDFDLGELRRIELESLDALKAAHWAMATGRFVTNFMQSVPGMIAEADDETRRDVVDSIERSLPRLVLESQRAAKVVMGLHDRKAKLLGLIEPEVDPSSLMPVVIFMAPRPARVRTNEDDSAIIEGEIVDEDEQIGSGL